MNKEETKKNSSKAVSLDEIKEAIENKITKQQKKSIIKECFINLGIAVVMVLYLIIVLAGKNNILNANLEKDIKIITLSILALGIFILEYAYKKDSTKTALYGIEILIFGASNLCLIYAIKLYIDKLKNVILYIGAVVLLYYLVKTIIVAIKKYKKFKNDNNDIKDIVKKKVKKD